MHTKFTGQRCSPTPPFLPTKLSINAGSLPNELKTSDVIVVTLRTRILTKEVGGGSVAQEIATAAPPSSYQQPHQQHSSSPESNDSDGHERIAGASRSTCSLKTVKKKKNKLTVTDTPTGDLVVCEQNNSRLGTATPPQQHQHQHQQEVTGTPLCLLSSIDLSINP